MTIRSLQPAPIDRLLTANGDASALALQLLQHGVKPTALRLRVFDALCAAAPGGDELVTPEALYQALRHSGDTVVVTSIYNALAVLVDAALVDRYRLGDAPALYRPHRGQRFSVLLQCGDCGDVRGSHSGAMQACLDTVATEQDFTLTEPTVVLRGRCRTCASCEAPASRRRLS